jgi:hypothetical protein
MTNQETIQNAFSSQTYIAGQMDVQHTPVYDTVTLAAGTTVTQLNTSFFTNVGPISGKTYAQTNMNQPGKLQAPEAFSIMSFRLRWAGNVLASDIYGVLSNFCLEFYLGTKIYQRAPLWHFNAGGGVFGVTDVASTSIISNGYPGRESMHKLAIPIVIENQASFYAQLTGGTYALAAGSAGGTGLTLQLLLDGLYARGIQ